MKKRFETELDKGIDIQEELVNLGGGKGLFMFLSGKGGSGEITTVFRKTTIPGEDEGNPLLDAILLFN